MQYKYPINIWWKYGCFKSNYSSTETQLLCMGVGSQCCLIIVLPCSPYTHLYSSCSCISVSLILLLSLPSLPVLKMDVRAPLKQANNSLQHKVSSRSCGRDFLGAANWLSWTAQYGNSMLLFWISAWKGPRGALAQHPNTNSFFSLSLCPLYPSPPVSIPLSAFAAVCVCVLKVGGRKCEGMGMMEYGHAAGGWGLFWARFPRRSIRGSFIGLVTALSTMFRGGRAP